ncbi:MAG: hypothetical protein M1319_06600 [Chloroflexi bacterium]|nr:hypothetical protein [Chloroflexota bacterium]
MLTATVSGVTNAISYSYDNDNRMTAAGTVTYTWDDDGNMLSRTDGITTTDYTYDYENRLTRIADGTNTSSYTYDGNGLRTSATRNGTTTNYLWDSQGSLPEIVQDTTITGTDTITNTYLNGTALIMGVTAHPAPTITKMPWVARGRRRMAAGAYLVATTTRRLGSFSRGRLVGTTSGIPGSRRTMNLDYTT